MPTTEDVYKELKQVFDPEIPVNIVDLGLVYDVKLDDAGACTVTMTLTSQSCPEARTIPEVMKRRINALPGVTGTQIEIVWDPAWSPQKISEEGRKMLGIDQEDDD
jgi:metal-sulfur cluster biosynthetic enzyme